MRTCSSGFPFTAFRLAVVVVFVVAVFAVSAFSEDDFLNDDIFATPESVGDWTTDLDRGAAGLFMLNSDDDGVVMDDEDFSLALLPTTGEDPIASYLAGGCSAPGGIETRDEDSLCPVVPLKKEDVPTLPTFGDMQNAGENPDIDTEEPPLSPTEVLPANIKDRDCPPTHPHHFCCICDGVFAFEICRDCVGCEQRASS